MKPSLGDILIGSGILLFIYSCWCFNHLLGMFVASWALILIGILMARGEVK